MGPLGSMQAHPCDPMPPTLNHYSVFHTVEQYLMQVQNEDPSHKHLLAFNHAWTTTLQAVPQGQPRPLLVLSTGRSPTLLRHLWEEAPLLTPGDTASEGLVGVGVQQPTAGGVAW